jgi:CMP-N-acetylneuraminic acid synthetase
MSTLAIIPARSGSKRLPDKNLRDLAGKPLIAHTCEAAVHSGLFASIYVNTDSQRIADAAAEHGATCPFLRPAQLAADETPTRDANGYMLETLAQRGETYDDVVVLQPTSPLRTAADIRAAYSLFEQNAPCAVVSTSPVAASGWLGRIGKDLRFEPLPSGETIHRLNGAIYIYAVADYINGGEPRRTLAYVMPPERGVDIDTAEDLNEAEYRLRHAACPAG